MLKNSTSPINSSKPISNQLRNSPQAHPTNRARIRSISSSRQIQIELFENFELVNIAMSLCFQNYISRIKTKLLEPEAMP